MQGEGKIGREATYIKWRLCCLHCALYLLPALYQLLARHPALAYVVAAVQLHKILLHCIKNRLRLLDALETRKQPYAPNSKKPDLLI